MEELNESIQSYVQGDQLHAVIAATAIILVTAIVSHLLTRLIKRIMQPGGIPVPSASILINVERIVIWWLGISVTLSACFNVDVNAMVAALGVGGIALSLGLQDTIKNFIGGMQVTLMGIVHPGDHVVVGSVDGIAEDVSWRQTVVRDPEGNQHLIPNSVINSTTVTKVEPNALVVTRISFTNDGRDLDAMIAEMEYAAKMAVSKVAELEKDPWILLTEIGEYGTWGKMRFILKEPVNVREARDAALRAIAPYTRNDSTVMLTDNGADD